MNTAAVVDRVRRLVMRAVNIVYPEITPGLALLAIRAAAPVWTAVVTAEVLLFESLNKAKITCVWKNQTESGGARRQTTPSCRVDSLESTILGRRREVLNPAHANDNGWIHMRMGLWHSCPRR
jgi:hypothetical protein